MGSEVRGQFQGSGVRVSMVQVLGYGQVVSGIVGIVWALRQASLLDTG